MTTSHRQADLADLHVRIHALEQDAKDREYYILHLKARNLVLMDRLRDLGVPMTPPVAGTAHHKRERVPGEPTSMAGDVLEREGEEPKT